MPRSIPRKLERGMIVGLISLTLGCLLSPATAQYTYDPNNADEQGFGVIFFGSAKSVAGDRLSNVRVLITGENAVFDLLTDYGGRFRQLVPPDFAAANWHVVCSKNGFVQDTLTTRLGPPGARPSVQIDCILRPSHHP